MAPAITADRDGCLAASRLSESTRLDSEPQGLLARTTITRFKFQLQCLLLWMSSRVDIYKLT